MFKIHSQCFVKKTPEKIEARAGSVKGDDFNVGVSVIYPS